MMGRLWIAAAANGKFRILLGPQAAREKKRIAREIDRTIGKALSGDLDDQDLGSIERLALLADRLARGGAG